MSFLGNGEADIQNRLVDTVEEGEWDALTRAARKHILYHI